ncbi:unnamed protein product, partial [Thlaspi arvense]
MVITTTVYCLLAVTLCLMQDYRNVDVDAPFSVAFQAVGWNWAKYIVAAGALKGMTSVLLVGAVGQARYLTHIARTHMMPPWFAHVDQKTGTPINATVTMMAATGIIAFFTELDILSNLLSISTLFIFMLVALALLVRRYYLAGVTTSGNRTKLVVFLLLILGSSITTAIYWALSDGWILYCITGPIWFLATLGLRLFVPHAREAKLWESHWASFARFGVWTGLLLVYYFLFGLHASYDTAKEMEGRWRKIEEGTKSVDKGVA